MMKSFEKNLFFLMSFLILGQLLNFTDTYGKDNTVFLDDFEESGLFIKIPIMRKSWFRSGIPYFEGFGGFGNPNLQVRAHKRGKLIWYNPWQQVKTNDIFPYKEINTRTGTVMNVLVLKRIARSSYYQEPDVLDWWGGISGWLLTPYCNQSKAHFIDVWTKGGRGKVHIDIGLISEDAIPNGKLDTEDTAGGIANGIVDEGEDNGLDGIDANDGPESGEPFDDDWGYSFKSGDYSKINGTEGNGSGAKVDGLLIPDTEDINQNGVLDTRNDYFEYTFNLGKSHPDFDKFVVSDKSNAKGWFLYRIPIGKYSKKVGNPDIARIESIRIWVEGLEIDDEIQIASLGFIHNEWIKRGVSSDFNFNYFEEREGSISISAVNTVENSGMYETPPGVSVEIDRVTGAKQQEQSLSLYYDNILPGEAVAIQNDLSEDVDMSNFKWLRMFVYGDENILVKSDSISDVSFFLRFGQDENNYYEIREYIFPGWDERNEIIISLKSIGDLRYYGGFSTHPVWCGGKYFRVNGSPDLKNVKTVTMGIINNSETASVSGDVWCDELRITSSAAGLEAPYKGELFQSYPNPFNRTAIIKYFIPKKSDVSINVYNILGQKIKTLFNDNQVSGYYSVHWDGTNEFGSEVASGIYLYQIKTEDFVQTKKLTILK